MKENLIQKIDNWAKTELEGLKEASSAALKVLGIGIPVVGLYCTTMYTLISNLENIKKVCGWIADNPYETALGVTGVTALGIGTYRFVEKKLHETKTLDGFVEKAQKKTMPVTIELQIERGLLSYNQKITVKAGKIRYVQNEEYNSVITPEFGFGLARVKAIRVSDFLATCITLAKHLEKRGLEVRINGKNLDDTKNYLKTCKEWNENGYTFIAG